MQAKFLHSRSLNNQLGIARRLEKELHSIGIMTMDDLLRVGSVKAYCLLQKPQGKKLSVKYLYAFEGAIVGEHWFDFSEEQKAAIRAKAGLSA